MKRYRKKIVRVKAWQWDEKTETLDAIKECGLRTTRYCMSPDRSQTYNIWIASRDGSVRADKGDWILQSEDGTFDVVSDQRFQTGFELDEEKS